LPDTSDRPSGAASSGPFALVLRAAFVPEGEQPPPEFASDFSPLKFRATLDRTTGVITCDNAGMNFGGSGFDFEISETDCDTLAKDASISVFATRVGRANKTLVFKYGPDGVDDLPVITSMDQHEVQISIEKISDQMYRLDHLPDLAIAYKIGVIEYPDNSMKPNE